MASLKTILFGLFATTALAMPSGPRFTKRQLHDLDILQFALTLEHLEDTFYREAFLTLSDEAFAPLGLSTQTLDDIKAIGKTEAAHVVLLQSALAGNGITPVQECKYDFKGATADPAAMVATAAILESVGVSAYLGAAPLLSDPAILGTAGAILTVEARHQTAIRIFSQAKAIEAFPTLAMAEGQDVKAVAIGTKVKLASEAAAGATHCGFTSGGQLPGGTKFTTFTEGEGCEVPQGAAGVVYVTLTSAGPLEGVLSDDITVAGPMVLTLS
ncbi:Ferritin-like [Fusarium oxysporum f. sp. vasinfectum]|nr:Ferritin-like [Fusarium oxysporum f. sp. vasinfectum]